MNLAMTAGQVDFRFQSVSRSHSGRRRERNEDRVLDCPSEGLWAVVDGMGGHIGGEMAAIRVVKALQSIDHSGSGYGRLSQLLSSIEAVNASLFDGGGAMGGARRTGATLVTLLAHEGHFACLWAGDSRAYLYRQGCLAPITRDHSLVQQLIDDGALLEIERHSHPKANVVTRAVGAAACIDLDRRFAPIMGGDVFLLCSDGLTTCLAAEEIAERLDPSDLPASADALLDAALRRMAPDNVSLVLVRANICH